MIILKNLSIGSIHPKSHKKTEPRPIITKIYDATRAPTYDDYSHIRRENPPLGINDEGWITPLVGVIQTVSTVIGKGRQVLTWNNVIKAKAGYNTMELAIVNPHITSKQARDCANYHSNNITMVYGIDGGNYDTPPQTI